MAADEAAKKKASSSTTAAAAPPSKATTTKDDGGEVVYPSLPSSDITSLGLLSNTKTILPFPPAPTTPYPTRSPTATQFHHSSAGIDPMGAYNRPIKPLPKRRIPTTITTCNYPSPPHLLHHLQMKASQHPSPGPGARPLGPLSLLHHHHHHHRQIAARASEQTTVRRIVSGSFGSFEGPVGRFDERVYRLGGRRKEDEEGGEKKLNPFKGRPWLRE